jgi:hypothetical protein
MAKKLFNLRNVPEEEAEEVRQLLTDNHIDFYETPPGNWGISLHALWVTHDEEHEKAKTLLDEYQEKLGVRVREEFEAAKARGENLKFWHVFRTQPGMVIIYIIAILLVLFFSTIPFIFL